MIVCRCNNVSEKDVRDFYMEYSEMPKETMKTILNIGTRCRCCLKDNCNIIDKKFENVFDNLKEIHKN